MSTFGDKQHVKMQESQENVPDGETPHHIQLCAFEEHVDFVRPGDRVEVVGIFRAQPMRVNSGRRNVRNIFTTYIDVVSYKKTDSSRLGIETEIGNADKGAEMVDKMIEESPEEHHEFVKFSESEIKDFQDFSKTSNIYEKLVEVFAPSIYENDDVKKGVVL